MAEIEIGEWLPDQPARNNPGALLAKNCIPEAVSYRDFKGLQGFAEPLTGEARGSFWIRASSGVVYNFAADAGKLYLWDGAGQWDDVSKPATTYSASNWDFTNFQDRVIATDGGSGDVQYFDCGVSSTFLDLPGSPPRCKVLGTVRDFVLLGNYAIGLEVESGGLAWSGFNSSELWTPSLATQSGRRRTRGIGGEVKRIVSGTQAMVWRESAIMLVSYIGPPNIFQVDDVTTLHGTPAARAVAWTKDVAFYYADEGFHQINRRNLQIDAIGVGKVDKWFRENVAAADIVNMQGTVDRRNNLVYWAFRSTTSSVPFNRILVYNWAFKRFTYAELEVEYIGEFSSTGYNLDTIGAILGGNIDSASINVDSDAYSGGALSLMGFSPSHVSSTFDGLPLIAEFDTTEMSLPASRKGFQNGVEPFVESRTSPIIQVAPVTRQLITANPSVGAFVPVNSTTGRCDMRQSARFHRYRIKVAGGFDHARGIGVDFKTRGRR